MKRTWWIIGGVAVAAVLVAGTLLTGPKRPGQQVSGGPSAEDVSAVAASVAPTPARPNPGGSTAKASTPATRVVDADDAAAPNAPLAAGAKLPSIDVAPAKTVAMIEPKAASAGTYVVTFRPYGSGPAGTVQRLVIRIDSSHPASAVKKRFDFVRRNALVQLTPEAAATIKAGGKYTGTLELRPQNGLLVLWLDDVVASKSAK